MLPNDVLVEIFYFYVNDRDMLKPWINEWLRLVHVCQRWRYLVFASPRRLHLQLASTGKFPFEIPNPLPAIPVVISKSDLYVPPRLLPDQRQVWSNRVGALHSEHHDRICQIHLSNIPNSRVETISTALQKPFPALTDLLLSTDGIAVLDIPDSFLGGSAPPLLRTLTLKRCSFPEAQKFLLSANHLVTLSLEDIPDSGYISPDALVTALSTMVRLETLQLEFRSPLSHIDPGTQHPPPPTRTILPALTRLRFKGVHEYSEYLMARMDAPLLYNLHVGFFVDLAFEVPQLYRLISLTEAFNTFHRAQMTISNVAMICRLSSSTRTIHYHGWLWLEIRSSRIHRQLSSVAQSCFLSLPPISGVEELEISPFSPMSELRWGNDMESETTRWLELLNPFAAVQNLTVSYEFMPHVSHALEIPNGDQVTEVLPALRNLFLRGRTWKPYQKAIKTFVVARRLSGRPVTVHHLDQNGGWEDITDDLVFEG
jgi:F-box-like